MSVPFYSFKAALDDLDVKDLNKACLTCRKFRIEVRIIALSDLREKKKKKKPWSLSPVFFVLYSIDATKNKGYIND